MPSKKEIAKLSIAELKEELKKIWRKHERICRTSMAPLLYHLREKLKAQGKSGAGFGAWVEASLNITRRTADRWANDWAVSQNLRKPSKPKPKTFRQMSKSAKANPDGNVTVPLSFVLPEKEAEEFMAAMHLLGEKATSIIYDAVVAAARFHEKPAQAAQPQPPRRVTFLNDEEDGALAVSEQARV